MDTRNKLVDGATARRLAEAGHRVVAGYFDPLTAAHAARLSELAADRRLVVLAGDPPDPLMPNGARLELLAALEVVEAVSALEGFGELPRDAADERSADLARRGSLMAHIRARQALA